MNVQIYKKILEGKKIKKGNFIYDFYGVVPYEGDVDSPLIQVNIICKPDQSYVQQKFVCDITTIVYHYSSLISDYSIPIGTDYLLNFQEPVSVYINNHDVEKVLKTLNENLSHFSTDRFDSPLSFDLEFHPKENFYSFEEPNIGFNFLLDVKNIHLDGKKVENTSQNAAAHAEDITNLLNEDDDFRNTIDGILYQVLEPELEINDCEDIYFESYYAVKSINGKGVKFTD